MGIDFTACTMLPTLADGTPLSEVPRWRSDPNAWVKLWKHHAAQPQADRLNEVARRLRPDLSARHGGRISSEWFFPKVMQIVEESPALYAAADRLIEACDWVVWQLTGVERRSACPAGYKALWDADGASPRATSSRPCIPRWPRSWTTRCPATSASSASVPGA